MNNITHTLDGRPIISGCQVLPPMESESHFDAVTLSDTSKRKGNRDRNHADRFAMLNTFVDCSMAELSKAELATWLVLYRDTRNGTATTSQTDIARRIGASDRTVRNAIGRLAQLGLIVVLRRGSLSQGPSKYRIKGTGRSVESKAPK